MEDLSKHIKFNKQTYIVLTTRGSNIDIEGLPDLLDQPYAYLGIIGSKRRWAVTKKALIEKGVSEDKLSRVNSPIGLELRAETPEEIAVSIMAEIMMLKNKGTGKSMQV